MKRLGLLCLTFILFALITGCIHAFASVELEVTISHELDVSLHFEDMNSTVYGALKAELETNERKIPEIIRGNLEERNLTNIEYRWEPVDFNDAEKSITVRFYMSGSDMIDLTFGDETMRRTYHVRTDWRKFELNINGDFSLNFTEYFGKPVSDWNFENEMHPRYYYSHANTDSFDLTCYFVLPKEATEVRIAEDMETIVFELPSSLGEALLNSPFLILGAVIVAIIIGFLYRTMRESRERRLES